MRCRGGPTGMPASFFLRSLRSFAAITVFSFPLRLCVRFFAFTVAARPCNRVPSRRRSASSTPSFSMTITVSPEDPRAPEAQALLNAFVDEIRHRYDAPPADVGYFDPSLVSVPKSAFLVARVEGRAVGCGALVPLEDDVVEIKRMFVLPQERGHGIAKKILDRLQSLAQEFDYDRIRLETGTKQPESIALYGKSGFYRVPNFPPFENDHTAVCFEKRI
jgi:putative acetyltransferase